jgi:hypothetical protein
MNSERRNGTQKETSANHDALPFAAKSASLPGVNAYASPG